MTFPFEALVLSQRELGLVVAVAIGFLFGFVLERAGFGRATKLAAQFYLHDMTVFKVMFSAIVTAMLGLVTFAGLGLVDLGEVSRTIASWTYIWPMAIGGFVLGVGFIISGYCPGTSLVSTASGNVDGLFTFVGVAAGSFVYSYLLEIPRVATFHTSSELGAAFLYEMLGIPAPVLAVGVAIVAIAAFVGAEKVERIMQRRRDGLDAMPAPILRPRRMAFATATLAIPTTSSATTTPAPEVIDVTTLAHRVVDEPWTLRIIDLRPADAFTEHRIPGSENIAPEQLGEIGLQYMPRSRDIIVVGDGTASQVPPAVLGYPGHVYVLDGGWDSWQAFALDAPPTLVPGATDSMREAWEFRSSIHAAMTGQKVAPPPAAPPPTFVPKPKKKGGGCSA